MSNLSRRSLVTSAAALPALAIPTVASNNPDDTLSRIERHQACVLEIDAIVDRIGDLEAILPDELRGRSRIDLLPAPPG